MLDITKPVKTRNGMRAKIISTNMQGTFCMGVLIENKEIDKDEFGRYTIDGRVYGASSESPFDLVNVPKLDPTKPVMTRDGRKARILCTDRKDDEYPIIAAFMNFGEETSTEAFCSFSVDGLYIIGQENSNDLVNI